MPQAFVTALDSFASSVLSSYLSSSSYTVVGTVSSSTDLSSYPGSILSSDASSVSSALTQSSLVVVNLQGTDPAVVSTADSILSMMKFAAPKSPTKVRAMMLIVASYAPLAPFHPLSPLPTFSSPFSPFLSLPAHRNLLNRSMGVNSLLLWQPRRLNHLQVAPPVPRVRQP